MINLGITDGQNAKPNTIDQHLEAFRLKKAGTPASAVLAKKAAALSAVAAGDKKETQIFLS